LVNIQLSICFFLVFIANRIVTTGLIVTQARLLAFLGNSLDRCANHRTDQEWLGHLLKQPSTRHIHMNGDKTIVTDGKLQTFRQANSSTTILLGVDGSGAGWFASSTATEENLVDLRSLAVAGFLPQDELAILAQARSLLHWHEHHGFCANCGQPTEIQDAGYRRHCGVCATDHFPRTDPVIIVAVRHGTRMLLGRQSIWPEGMYSTLAGFMEPGETIEEAARREVFEEAGIRVGQITFHSNQPWPFPSSLMIGLIGEALTDEIAIDPKELETARWFEEDEVRSMLDGTHSQGIKTPLPLAIAHHLIRACVQSS
jgi:NAD+ diphosphatase